jgi:hypothetical protein
VPTVPVTLCVCVVRYRDVKSITLSVPDDVYRAARIRAAERGVSLSALVGRYLRALSGGRQDFGRLYAQQQQVQKEIAHFRAADRLSRDELHSRAIH